MYNKTPSEFKPKLYDKPVPLSDITFEELITLLEPRIRFHAFSATKDGEKIPGFDFDDIKQELLIRTHVIIRDSKLPDDLINFDYRFLRYMDRVYTNSVNLLYRSKISKRRGDTFYRDALNSALTMIDDFDKLISGE